MAVFKEWQGIGYILQLIIINSVVCLTWLSAIAFAQLELSEAATGSVSFPEVATACIGNLAVYFTTLLRGRLDLENGARDVLATNRGPKINEIKGSGLTTCDVDHVEDNDGKKYKDAKVLMLSENPSNANSIHQFMKYVHHSHGVHSILLKCARLRVCPEFKADPCPHQSRCDCIGLWIEEEEIRMMIDRMMPGTVKRLSKSQCLLPCSPCLKDGCHECLNQTEEDYSIKAEIHAEPEPERTFREEDSKAEEEESTEEIHPNVQETRRMADTVCRMFEFDGALPVLICICIPLCEAVDDEWTKLMIRFLRSKDQVSREVRVLGSDAMEKYIYGRGEYIDGREEDVLIEERYSHRSLIVPRLIEVAVNIVLTGWLRVDGLSSSLIARRVVRDHLVDSKGTAFNANAFLTSAIIQCNRSSVCQLLRFRGKIAGVRTLSYIVGFVNLVCSISWGVLMACEGRYGRHSMPPSKPRLALMLACIGLALFMDFVSNLPLVRLYFSYPFEKLSVKQQCQVKREAITVFGVMLLQILYVVLWSVMVVRGMGIGKWVYGVFQILIWVKWGIGSFLLGDRDHRVDADQSRSTYLETSLFHTTWLFDNALVMYSSAFMLNAILAGVRGTWEY